MNYTIGIKAPAQMSSAVIARQQAGLRRGMMGGYVRAMRQYAVFRGRASRAEFWQYTAVLVGLSIIALIIDGGISKEQGKPDEVVTAILGLAHLLPSYAVTARRLHDTDRSGWMILLVLIPFVGLVLVAFLCLRGTPGPNHYGAAPVTTSDPTVGPDGQTVPRTSTVPLPPTGSGRTDVIAELERLGRLRREGHLSEAEFEVMKAETLTHARR